MARIRIILHGKAAGNSGLRTAVHDLRHDGRSVEVRVTWEPGDAARMTAQAVSEASTGNIDCIVAGGGDGTINEVFGAAYAAGLPSDCCLGVLPLGTANDFAHSTGVPLHDLTAALQLAATARDAREHVGQPTQSPLKLRVGFHRDTGAEAPRLCGSSSNGIKPLQLGKSFNCSVTVHSSSKLLTLSSRVLRSGS